MYHIWRTYHYCYTGCTGEYLFQFLNLYFPLAGVIRRHQDDNVNYVEFFKIFNQ